MNLENWLNLTEAKLTISRDYFHHHAYEIINSNNELKDFFEESLNQFIEIKPRIKKSKNGLVENTAINANHLNSQIRKALKNINSNTDNIDISLEVIEDRGVFYFATGEKNAIGGFDFAILNHQANLTALRNLCYGEIQYHDAGKRWQKFLTNNASLREMAREIEDMVPVGKNIVSKKNEKKQPLIVGEIQFGNWALAYRDFFKVLKADVQNNIDCLIYIVPTGNLEKNLSEGIVTFDKTVKIIEDFSKVISVPIWLIGIDIEIDGYF